MSAPPSLLTPHEAAGVILQAATPQPPVRIPLDDALDMVLAETITSPVNVPAHANSAMDGYAARAEDVRGASAEHPVRLRVVERVAAGQFPARPIGPGECSRILTGAPLPPGADSVIRQEDTDEGADTVTIRDDRDAGGNWRRAGEDIARGAVVLEAGAVLGPAALGVLASVGCAHPVVHRRPRVGILCTGDEIADLDQADAILAGQKVGSSNSHTLRALVTQAGGQPVDLGIAPDDPDALAEHLGRSADCDLVITSGGVSVGEHDHLRATILRLGGEVRFWRVRLRPGGPVAFGTFRGIPWLGLPGNPVSTMVTFELFARPAIRRMAGHARPFRRPQPVRVDEPIILRPRLQHFLRARAWETDTGWQARLTGPQGSGILTSMLHANALLMVPEGQFDTPRGSVLPALLLEDPRHQPECGY